MGVSSTFADTICSNWPPEIGVEKNTTIVLPLPIDLMSAFEGALRKVSGK